MRCLVLKHPVPDLDAAGRIDGVAAQVLLDAAAGRFDYGPRLAHAAAHGDPVLVDLFVPGGQGFQPLTCQTQLCRRPALVLMKSDQRGKKVDDGSR
jgi:hypothetical protein